MRRKCGLMQCAPIVQPIYRLPYWKAWTLANNVLNKALRYGSMMVPSCNRHHWELCLRVAHKFTYCFDCQMRHTHPALAGECTSCQIASFSDFHFLWAYPIVVESLLVLRWFTGWWTTDLLVHCQLHRFGVYLTEKWGWHRTK